MKINEVIKIRSLDKDGVIVKLSGNKVKVRVKGAILMVDVNDIIPTGIVKRNKHSYFMHKTNLKVREFDMHGLKYDQAVFELENFFNSAISSKTNKIRIVHGYGSGVMRKITYDMIEKYSDVISLYDYAPLNQGGMGATIVLFNV